MKTVLNAKKILLIKLRHHGDVLLSTPVARALKTAAPDCRIDLLLYKETRPIVEHNRDYMRIWTIDRSRKGLKRLFDLAALATRLRRERYDLIVHLSDQSLGALLTRWSRPRRAIGFDYPKRRNSTWARCFDALAPVADSDSLHTVEQNLLALSPLGLDVPVAAKRCKMAYSEQDRLTVQAKLHALGVTTPYIAVHPASRWFFKCWEDERFAAVVQVLADKGWHVVLTAAPVAQEEALVRSILDRVDSERVHSLAGQLTLTSLAALIDGARLFIGVDSVPMHMAAALGRDTVALFGPSKVNEWRPWMTRHTLIHAADYGPLIDPDAVDTGTSERYLSNIPVDAVLDAAQALLAAEEPAR
ncbi:heptosyltransferase-3 [Crenobacter luteus]|uniref:putative lipopolysaccharide heptosyltransferase III n=1 Tax=Crenobacter luteus TaxID=1452487 RepID=UPI0010477054|nr:putative lipopolysaccharide heptosyltransferase III [Crenobacter luteus]TCP13089.1 heptosyltransferase-3 [Crenobacter luteus]